MTAIQWTDRTVNPLLTKRKLHGNDKLGWWCVKTSPGCANCYSCTLNCAAVATSKKSTRRGNGAGYQLKAATELEPFLDEALLDKMLRWRKPKRIFPVDMSDAFLTVDVCNDCGAVHERDKAWDHCKSCCSPELKRFWPSEWIQQLLDTYDTLAQRGFIIQSLTKRPERMLQELRLWSNQHKRRLHSRVHIGFSAENQECFDRRWPVVRLCAAYVDGLFWVSYEPALGEIDFSKALPRYETAPGCLRWIVVGGESGRGCRVTRLGHIESCVDQANKADVRVFVKQLGSLVSIMPSPYQLASGGMNPANIHTLANLTFADKKGGDPDEWPLHLRQRQFPEGLS